MTMGTVALALLSAREPRQDESYQRYLESFGLLGPFAFSELVTGGPRKMLPPRSLWRRMVPTLALATELRERMAGAGARGLSVHAAFRPEGGAADSQHKHNAALDLDLARGDERLAAVFAETAAKLWREHEHLRCGAGTYAPDGRRWTHRVHLDTGYRFRCWQGIGAGAWARRPAIVDLAPPHVVVSGDVVEIEGWHEIAGVQVAMDRARESDCTGGAWPR